MGIRKKIRKLFGGSVSKGKPITTPMDVGNDMTLQYKTDGSISLTKKRSKYKSKPKVYRREKERVVYRDSPPKIVEKIVYRNRPITQKNTVTPFLNKLDQQFEEWEQNGKNKLRRRRRRK